MIGQLLKELAKVNGSKFASFTYSPKVGGTKYFTADNKNRKRVTAGKSRYNVILGTNTENAYERQIAHLTGLIPTLSGIDLIAAQEILESRQNSLRDGIGNNAAYTQKDVDYITFPDLPGVYLHPNGTLSLRCKVQSAVEIEPATWADVKSSDKTLAKARIESGLPSSGFVTFILRPEHLESAKLNGATLEIS